VQRRRLAGRRRVGGEDDLADAPGGDARVELGDLEVLGVDAVDRRQRAAEDVVAPAVLVRALDRDDVAGLLDDADQAAVAALVLADAAARLVGEVEADLAEPDALLDLADRMMWKARRWAVRWPTPGSLPSSVMRRWTGGGYKRAR